MQLFGSGAIVPKASREERFLAKFYPLCGVKWGFPKIWGTFWAIPRMNYIILGSILDPPVSGKYQRGIPMSSQ